MAKTQFFFYNLEVKPKEGETFDILKILKEIKKEKEDDKIEYVDICDNRVCIVINKIIEEEDGKYVLGKFIATKDSQLYREESGGDFYELALSQEDSQLCNIEKGALFFLLYIPNDNPEKTVLMFEEVYFSVGVGGFRTYFKKRYDVLDEFITRQKLGRDLKPALESVSNSGLKVARMRVNRNITPEQLNKLGGPVEKAAPLLLDDDIDCELVFRFKKDKKNFYDFLTEVFKKENITDLLGTEFGDFFRTLNFSLENTANPKFNFFDKVFKYPLPYEKSESINKENDIFDLMLSHFQDNREDILDQE